MTAEQSGTYTEFHRKYQPKIWDDFIGQDEIVAQLKRDIIEGRHVQGRLFQGKAGTGKSSTVKVFTKALNCENRPEGSADPCLVCESCVRFDNEKHGGMAYFVASEAGGVDKVRSIIQSGSIKQMMKAPLSLLMSAMRCLTRRGMRFLRILRIKRVLRLSLSYSVLLR